MINRNFILRTTRGKYVLRQVSHIHHKTPRDLKFELSYLDYLEQSNFPCNVPSAIPTRNGGLFVTVEGHYYWLYRFLEGRVVESLNQPHLAQLAQMMARYHALIIRSNLHNGKPASDPYGRTTVLKEMREFRAAMLRKNNIDRQERTFLDESVRLTEILRGFDARPRSDLELYPIHSDLLSENLIWNQGKLAGIIDFEHVSQTNDPLVKDIAVTMQYCCRDSKLRHKLDIGSAERFLGSYRESRRLSDEEIVMIPDLMTASFIGDFVFAFWMLRNDPKRAKQSEEEGYGLTLGSRAAQWSHSNREMIARALLS